MCPWASISAPQGPAAPLSALPALRCPHLGFLQLSVGHKAPSLQTSPWPPPQSRDFSIRAFIAPGHALCRQHPVCAAAVPPTRDKMKCSGTVPGRSQPRGVLWPRAAVLPRHSTPSQRWEGRSPPVTPSLGAGCWAQCSWQHLSAGAGSFGASNALGLNGARMASASKVTYALALF